MRTARVARFHLYLLALALAAVSTVAVAHAQQADKRPIPVNVLDGHSFSGMFVPEDKASGRSDAFVFADGKFHSRECLKFGFTPGPYWLRTENGRLHFLARLTSQENGLMTYEGTVEGSSLDARIEWIRPRWYWTMKRNFRFRGAAAAADEK